MSTQPSSGCGKALPEQQVPTIAGSRTGYTEWHVTLTGETLGDSEPSKAGDRQFFVRVPTDYDINRPYRVVYIGSEYGAFHAGNSHTYPLFDENQGGTEQAIYVGLSVAEDMVNPGGYDVLSGAQSEEWEVFDLIHTFVEQTYCVDNDRIYVVGHHPGAALAWQWGCYFGGLPSPPLDAPDVASGRALRKFSPKWAVRGSGGVAGVERPSEPGPLPCNGPAAEIAIHDALDQAVLIETAIDAFNLNLQANGCTGNYLDGPKEPWAPAEDIPGLEGGLCQLYTGCPAETAARYPLVFCTTSGFGHADQAERAMPAFKMFFDLMDPK